MKMTNSRASSNLGKNRSSHHETPRSNANNERYRWRLSASSFHYLLFRTDGTRAMYCSIRRIYRLLQTWAHSFSAKAATCYSFFNSD